MTSTPPLDIERIIRRARLRSAREPDAAVMGMLFQRLHRHDPSTRLHQRLISEEGSANIEMVFAIEYRNQLWSLHGQGDWSQIVQHAIARSKQTWISPSLAGLPHRSPMSLRKPYWSRRFH